MAWQQRGYPNPGEQPEHNPTFEGRAYPDGKGPGDDPNDTLPTDEQRKGAHDLAAQLSNTALTNRGVEVEDDSKPKSTSSSTSGSKATKVTK